MPSSYAVILSRSGSRFSLLQLPFPTVVSSPADRCPLFSSKTQLPVFRKRHRTRDEPFRTKVASNDASIASQSLFRETMNFYDLLGIPETGSLLEIKQAYKQLARKYHPDVSPPDQVEEYTERFIQVQEAYETLSDPRRRALYDRDMSRGFHFAFSARRRYQTDEMEDTSEWKTRWQSQLWELKRRSMSKEGSGNMSWAARMQRQRDEKSS